MKKIFVINSIFLYRKLNPNVTAIIPLSSLYGISCRFEFHNLWRVWKRQHLLFYNLALFTIYGNDGTAISTWGVIININKYRWEKVYEVNTCRKLKLRTMILFISNSWSCFSAKVCYIHISFSFHFNHTEIEELRMDIKSCRGIKVKLKLFLH